MEFRSSPPNCPQSEGDGEGEHVETWNEKGSRRIQLALGNTEPGHGYGGCDPDERDRGSVHQAPLTKPAMQVDPPRPNERCPSDEEEHPR